MLDTKILVIDDDQNICELLKVYFENEGYEVKTVNDGIEGLSFFKMYEPDLVLLDIMLPKKDGLQVCREIREMSSKPIIMITAKDDVFNTVLGLELGADDYVAKPFGIMELISRVKAVLRRAESRSAVSDIHIGSLMINPARRSVRVADQPVALTLKEYQLLMLLASLVYVLEALSVVIQVFYFKYTKRKTGEGKRIFKMTPIHHHFEMSGFSEYKIVITFSLTGIIFGVLGIITLLKF